MGRALRAAAVAGCFVLASCAATLARPPAAQSYADYLIGRVANARDDHAAAADHYFDALARSPHDEALLRGALSAALALGDERRARQVARMAPREEAPALAHVIRAIDLLRAGDWRRAAAEADRAEGGAAEEMIARTLVVWARVGEWRVDDVLVQLEPFASIRPYGGLFAYQQALALDYAGRNGEAVQAYNVALGGGMWLPAGVEHHADLLARLNAAETARTLLNEPAVSRGNPALAAALARVSAGQPPARGRLTPARGAAIGLYGLGAIFLQEHDPGHGLASLSLALMLDPGLDEARISMAEAHSRLENFDAARAALANVPADSAYAVSAEVLGAWLLLDGGRQEEALAHARASAAGGDARAERALADMYRQLGRAGEAEPIYSRMIEADPQNWRLFYARGAARERLGRWEDAEADLRRALELAPDNPDIMNYLGYSWVDRGVRLREGLALIERAAELRPMSGAIIDSLGWAHYRLGNFAEALIHLERAVELDPGDATLNDHLGDVYWRLGRRIEARFQWRRALTLEPDDAASIEAKLENGLPAAAPTQSATR